MKPVAIIQHEDSVPPGLVREIMREEGVDHFTIEASKDTLWPFATALGGLVVLGGTMNVDQFDEFPFLKASRDLMAAALEARLPTLGICLGSQMMARILGADVRPAESRNALFSPLELTDEGRRDRLVAPFSSDVEVLQFHEDTFAVPEDAVLLASSRANGLAQAFRYGDNAYAIQFHFEVDGSIVRGWVDDIGEQGMVERWNSSDAGSSLHREDRLAAQEIAGRAIMKEFLQLVWRG